jgi:hypothetical protein
MQLGIPPVAAESKTRDPADNGQLEKMLSVVPAAFSSTSSLSAYRFGLIAQVVALYAFFFPNVIY